MSYNPTEWMTGDVITAEKLNHAEQEITKLSQGGVEVTKTPTTIIPEQTLTPNEQYATVENLNVPATIDQDGGNYDLQLYAQLPDTLIVTYDGTEYEVEKSVINDTPYYGDLSESFVNPPFLIWLWVDDNGEDEQGNWSYTISSEVGVADGVTSFTIEAAGDVAETSISDGFKTAVKDILGLVTATFTGEVDGDGYDVIEWAPAWDVVRSLAGHNSWPVVVYSDTGASFAGEIQYRSASQDYAYVLVRLQADNTDLTGNNDAEMLIQEWYLDESTGHVIATHETTVGGGSGATIFDLGNLNLNVTLSDTVQLSQAVTTDIINTFTGYDIVDGILTIGNNQYMVPQRMYWRYDGVHKSDVASWDEMLFSNGYSRLTINRYTYVLTVTPITTAS